MAHTPVRSSNIAWVDYHTLARELYVGFSRGDVYVYYSVPSWVVDEMTSAASVGAYFYANLYHGYNRNLIGQWRSTGKGVTYDRASDPG